MPGAARQRRRCDSCQRIRRKSYGKPRRTLRCGEEPPRVEPARYLAANGYVKLVWSADHEVVEAYEHRFVAQAPEGSHVHHINHDPTDNRPDNLQIIGPNEHAEYHGNHNRSIDVDRAKALYFQGLGTTRIAKMLGHDPSAVWRALKREGIPTRQQFGGKRPIHP